MYRRYLTVNSFNYYVCNSYKNGILKNDNNKYGSISNKFKKKILLEKLNLKFGRTSEVTAKSFLKNREYAFNLIFT